MAQAAAVQTKRRRPKRDRSRHVGMPVLRHEDRALLTGRGRFADDIPVKAGTLHAAILRSPHAHAEIISIDTSAARDCPAVVEVVTGADVAKCTDPFIIGFQTALEYRPLATDRVRYVGEPVAVVLAEDRYTAEDALDLVHVDYRPLQGVVDPLEAARPDAPVLHPKVGSNVVNSRHFIHGNPDKAFDEAPRRTSITVRYPRNSIPPIECYVVVAEHDSGTDGYDVLANFMGPFSLHPVMARALGIPGSKLRLRTPPNSGGSFGVKMTVFPFIVLMCVAARLSGRPVKWVEDRLEHLAGACAAPNRVTEIEGAHDEQGVISAIRLHHWDDHGAYMRAPMPAPIYRSQAMATGPYRIEHVDNTIDVVTTNKTPTGAVRGFGAPQTFFALERLIREVAVEIEQEPLEVLRRNLLPADAFPYQSPAGALLDSGDFLAVVDATVKKGRLDELRKRCDAARAEGRIYGIGFAAVLEPGQSNMGYISTVKTAEERSRAGPKDGAVATATVAVDPLGSVSVSADSVPQGQGHATVLAQVVADQLGLRPDDIVVNLEMDTQKDGWSIAAGNYSCRFGPVVSGAVHLAAQRIRDRMARIAAQNLNVATDDLEFSNGTIFARSNPGNAVAFHRIAGLTHWSPGSLPEGLEPGLRETMSWSPPPLSPTNDSDQINSMLVYGFGFDFCGVEIDRDTGEVRVDRYVSAHDCGPILNPAIAEGQIRGSFAAGVNASLYEELAYADDGTFLSGTFADYLVATAPEMPEYTLVDPGVVTPSPFTPLGAKSVSEGNTNSTPSCIANAVSDAFGRSDVELPLLPSRLSSWIHGPEAKRRGQLGKQRAVGDGRALAGEGSAFVPAAHETVWERLLDPDVLRRVIPGCESLEATGPNAYRATVTIAVGPVRGRFDARVRLSDLEPPTSARLSGELSGGLGAGRGTGVLRLEAQGDGTSVTYSYAVNVSGPAASIGGRMLDGASRILIGQFFDAFAREAGGLGRRGLWMRLLRLLRIIG